MDYKTMLQKLRENEQQTKSEFWKPKAGQYKVKALSELEDAPPYEEEGKEPQQRKMIHIQLEGKDYSWSMPFGLTPASTFGQLVNLGAIKGNLKDVEFTVVVTGDGKTKRFTVVV